ncbi:carbonic anhydrase [Vibrio astriarenae]|uniref:carbonic anhydrase n=1 Tax=Vibrio astriarenae TaxID=1481923 RepID=UPI0037361D70
MKRTLGLLSLAVFATSTLHAAEWDYSVDRGPEHWGEHSSLCSEGKNQSPIDINSSVMADVDELKIDYQGQVTGLTNNGHTLEGSLNGTNTLFVDGRQFELKQFHFHTPSENLLKSRQFPLEAHFVHANSQGNLAVVAVMFEQGNDSHELERLVEKVPMKVETVKLEQAFDVQGLLPSLDEYYRFNGSLTTPPCSEGVRWIVLKETKRLSEQQVITLNTAMGNNNRPVQPQNARLVLKNQ